MSLTVLQSRPHENSQSSAPRSDEPLTDSPEIWYHRILKRSVPTQTTSQHLKRARSFTSLKLAVSSPRSLKSLPGTRQIQALTSRDTKLSPRHMSLTDLQRSPTPDCRPPGTCRALSKYSSIESLTPDHSAFSYTSSQPTTPSPGRQLSYYLPAERELYPYRKMGQKGSTIIKHPIGANKKHISAANIILPESSTYRLDEQVSDTPLSPALHQHESSSKLPVPRRRSSLTALHLDSSHFEVPISHHPELQHRGSTISEFIKPLGRSPSTMIAPADRANRQDTLSPPQLSPRHSSIRLSSASSLTPSQSSQVPTQIHLPQTFPEGLMAVPAPPLNVTHYKCYQVHRRMLYSKNKIYPVPCMTCGLAEAHERWKCVWCALRVCGSCMAELDIKKRDLEELMTWLEKFEERGLEDEKDTMEKRKRESQRESMLRTSANPLAMDTTAKVLKEAR